MKSAGQGPALRAARLIIKAGQTFNITANLAGQGRDWAWMKESGQQYQVTVIAESLGPGQEYEFGPISGNLAGIHDPQVATLAASIDTDGIYLLSCWVGFPGLPPEIPGVKLSSMFNVMP